MLMLLVRAVWTVPTHHQAMAMDLDHDPPRAASNEVGVSEPGDERRHCCSSFLRTRGDRASDLSMD